jgi:hypothetical protein
MLRAFSAKRLGWKKRLGVEKLPGLSSKGGDGVGLASDWENLGGGEEGNSVVPAALTFRPSVRVEVPSARLFRRG